MKFYGLMAQRFCEIKREFQQTFEEAFAYQVRLRSVASDGFFTGWCLALVVRLSGLTLSIQGGA